MKRSRTILVTILAAVLALSACGPKTTAPTTQTTGAAPDGQQSGTVPAALQTIEGAAEDIIDIAPGGNWDKINADITSITDAWQNYQSQASQDGASQKTMDALSAALEQLQTAAAGQDAAATMQSANDISAAVVELFDLYHPAIPADIGRLDVYGRQIILDVQAGNWDAAANSLQMEQNILARLKPDLADHNGADAISQYEASLQTQQAGLQNKDANAVIKAARDALEIVDAMESLY